MLVVTGWQCDYYENNIRCEDYSKIQPHKDFNNGRVYCENHWKIVNKINQERKEFAIKQYKEKLINYLKNLFMETDNWEKQTITSINLIIRQELIKKIENGNFD